MTSKNQGSHQGDALGGRSKESQRRRIPDDAAIRTDADLTSHLRERERANDARGSSVAGIPELTPHADKKDLPPTAPGKSTRVDRDSDGQISRPFSHVEHNKPEKSAHGGSFDLGGQGRAYPSRTSVVEDANERDVAKLRESKRRQFSNNNTN